MVSLYLSLSLSRSAVVATGLHLIFGCVEGSQVHVDFGPKMRTLGLILGPLGLIWAPLATHLPQK